MLMNTGFTAVKLRGESNCIKFHDVDLLSLDDRNFYTYSPTPRHVAGFINKWGYRSALYVIHFTCTWLQRNGPKPD
jgi:hypothetical protein